MTMTCHSGLFPVKRKFLLFALITLCVCLVLITTMFPVPKTVLSYRSWSNVSIFNVVKMHLAWRPSHVVSLQECPGKLTTPGMTLGDVSKMEGIKFYDDVTNALQGDLESSKQWKKAFMPVMTKQDKLSLLLLFGVFQHAMDSAQLPFYLLHGSAIGAWRHKGLTPWDDDIDIAIPVSKWLDIRRKLSCIQGYTLDVSSNSKWAFFKDDSAPVADGSKRWPFLDLFLYTQDANYVWALNYVHLRKFVFPVDDVFPTQMVDFECFKVPVPGKLHKVLVHQYEHPETCVSHYHNHRTGEPMKVISKPCRDLSDTYPMVHVV